MDNDNDPLANDNAIALPSDLVYTALDQNLVIYNNIPGCFDKPCTVVVYNRAFLAQNPMEVKLCLKLMSHADKAPFAEYIFKINKLVYSKTDFVYKLYCEGGVGSILDRYSTKSYFDSAIMQEATKHAVAAGFALAN